MSDDKISRTPYGVEPEAKLELPNRSERFDPAASGSPSGPTLDQFWISDVQIKVGPRPASSADILALLREWGAKEVPWCKTHSSSAVPRLGMKPFTCWKAEFTRHLSTETCAVASWLVVPLDVLAADTGSET